MTQRLVVIPWQEYQTLKNNLIGGGKKDEVPPSKQEVNVEQPLEEVGILLKDKDDLSDVEQLKNTKIPHKEEKNPSTVTLPDKSPPGLPATGWLHWK